MSLDYTPTRSNHSIKRGTRFALTFYKTDGSIQCTWTGRKSSNVKGRPGVIKVVGEYVDWKGGIYVDLNNLNRQFMSITPISKTRPAFYIDEAREVREVENHGTYRVFEMRKPGDFLPERQ